MRYVTFASSIVTFVTNGIDSDVEARRTSLSKGNLQERSDHPVALDVRAVQGNAASTFRQARVYSELGERHALQAHSGFYDFGVPSSIGGLGGVEIHHLEPISHVRDSNARTFVSLQVVSALS
jgi:hypothetical protein